jgi:polyisoprenoid-binding protein YceI
VSRRRNSGYAQLWLALGFALAVADAAAADPGEPPGSITFVAENRFSTARGTFAKWRITRAEVDPTAPSAGVVEVEVDVASLDTGIERRDDHLRSADFFDVAKFPIARVRVHGAEPDGQSERGHPRYRAKFDLEIHGVKKTLDGEFEVVHSSPPTVEGGLTLPRVDFAIGDPYAWYNPGSIREEVPVRFRAVLPGR